MSIAALITWLITAAGGFYLLGTWLAHGGVRQQRTRSTRFPAPVIFGHFLLAAAGLVVWIIYLVADSKPLAWAAFFILLPVALLGFTMFARWIGARRAAGTPASPGGTPPGGAAAAGTPAGRAAAGGTHTATTAPAAEIAVPAESHLPVVVVMAHGLLAATTLVLVLLTAIGAG
jgi:hypothetical protein